MQYKGTGALLIKDLDAKQGIVSAYWSAFNNKDDGADIVVPGAWAKTIAERGPHSKQPRIKFLWQHEEKMLVAKPDELIEDATGLLATYQIPPTTLGQDILILYEYGVISEHSVGYTIERAIWDANKAARLLQECVLWEGSAVTWGMNSETPTVSVKALTHPGYLDGLAAQAKKIDDLLHNGRLRNDDLCESLERDLKALHVALAPTQAESQPYTIEGVLTAMSDLTKRIKKTDTATEPEPAPATPPAPAPAPRSPIKARDFDTIYSQDRSARDLMRDLDGLTDTLEDALTELLLNNGGNPDSADAPTVDTILSQFTARVQTWFAAAQQSDSWDDIADAAQSEATYMAQPQTYYDYWCSNDRAERRGFKAASTPAEPREMPDAPDRLNKSGRQISGANRSTITKALDGMSGAMEEMKSHHAAIADLMKATDPANQADDTDESNVDEDTGPDTTASKTRRATAEHPSQTGTTHQEKSESFDLAAALADLDALKTRLSTAVKG
jgi:HK97 family phage prohead protease